MITLSDELRIGRGYKRDCYRLPDDPEKVVKIEHTDDPSKNDNRIESSYYTHLQKHGVDFSHIARCYGWVETSLGRGLLFERIINHDGTLPVTLESMIKEKGPLDKQALEPLIQELGAYLKTNQILFADVGLRNILCQEIQPGTWRLVIIDGLGSTKMDLRFRLRMLFPLYNRYKIAIQWKRFIVSYERKFTLA